MLVSANANYAHKLINQSITALRICDELESSSTVRSLSLKDNRLGDAVICRVAHAIRNNTTLYRLNISGNRVTDVGCAALATALATNTSLGTLHMDDNPIGGAGVMALIQSLQHNTVLHTLTLNRLEDTHRGVWTEDHATSVVKALVETLAVNKTLRTLRADWIDYRGYKKILRALEQHNTTLLRLNIGFMIIVRINRLAAMLKRNVLYDKMLKTRGSEIANAMGSLCLPPYVLLEIVHRTMAIEMAQIEMDVCGKVTIGQQNHYLRLDRSNTKRMVDRMWRIRRKELRKNKTARLVYN